MKKLSVKTKTVLIIIVLLFLSTYSFAVEFKIWDRNRLNGYIGGLDSEDQSPGWMYENWFIGTFKFAKDSKFKLTATNEGKFSFKYMGVPWDQVMFGPGYDIAKYLSIDILGYYTFRKQLKSGAPELSDEIGVSLQVFLKASIDKKFFIIDRIRVCFNFIDEKYIRLQNLLIFKYKFGIFNAFIGDEVFYHLHGEEPLNMNFLFIGIGIEPLKFLSIDISIGAKFFNYKKILFVRFDVILKF